MSEASESLAISAFEEIPAGWDETTIGEIGEYINGRGFKKSEWAKEGLPIIRIQDLTGTGKEQNLYQGEIEDRHVVEPGDFLISWSATLGAFLWDGPRAALNQHIFKVESRVDKKFHYYLIQFILDDLYRHTHGSGMVHITKGKFESIRIGVPKTEEDQRRIVAEIEKQFSRLDEAVASLKRVKANLKRYKAAILKAAVEGKLTEEWRKQNPDVEPANKLLERILAERRMKWEEAELAKMMAKGKEPKNDKWKEKFKEPGTADIENLPPLPAKWVWAKLPHLGELNRGKSKHRPRNDPKLYGGLYPFVQTGDIRHAVGILKDYTQTYSTLGLAQSRLWPEGTLCITIAANIADTAILGLEACFPDSVVGFIPDSEEIDTEFIEYFIRTAKSKLDQFAPATAQKNINLAVLNEVAVPLPPYAEQCELVAAVDSKLSVAEEIERESDKSAIRLARLRQSVLARSFRRGVR